MDRVMKEQGLFAGSGRVRLMIGMMICIGLNASSFAQEKQFEPQAANARKTVKAIYILLADHYAGIVAFEKFRDQMIHASYEIERMKSWPLLRSYFMSGDVDMAYVISPQAMDMFAERANFRWVSLMHRDGNAMAINDLLNEKVMVPPSRLDRIPSESLIDAIVYWYEQTGQPIECAVPSLYATHTVVLYKYLKDHGLSLDLDTGKDAHVRAIAVAPPQSPAFLKRRSNQSQPALFEQSLPWADVVETNHFGHVAWYSKDVMPWQGGHVECIAIATDTAIAEQNEAVREVIYYIHLAGLDIERARVEGGSAMNEIASMIRKHIPEHNVEAIVQSLRADLNVINYRNLNLDIPGLEMIMDVAVEGKILSSAIDIDAFADEQFATTITGFQAAVNAEKNAGHIETD